MRSAGSSTRVAYDRTQDSDLQSQYLPPGQGSATSYPGHHNSQDRLTEFEEQTAVIRQHPRAKESTTQTSN